MDKYEEIRRIGKGSEGSVYLVVHRESGCEYVIKKIFTRNSRSTAMHEADILARLDHPHVLRYHESFMDATGDHLCIVTDYCANGTLADVIREHKAAGAQLAEERILQWAVQITLAIQYIHGMRILHRDLKCANIFLTKSDIIKVGDFGIAAQLEHTLDVRRTCVGSPYYMSPEVCQDQPYNRKSDMWALGCVLYEMCALAPPFGGANLMRVVSSILSGTYLPIPARYPPFLADAIRSMLQSDPAARPTASQLLQLPWARGCLHAFLSRAEARPSQTAMTAMLLSNAQAPSTGAPSVAHPAAPVTTTPHTTAPGAPFQQASAPAQALTTSASHSSAPAPPARSTYSEDHERPPPTGKSDERDRDGPLLLGVTKMSIQKHAPAPHPPAPHAPALLTMPTHASSGHAPPSPARPATQAGMAVSASSVVLGMGLSGNLASASAGPALIATGLPAPRRTSSLKGADPPRSPAKRSDSVDPRRPPTGGSIAHGVIPPIKRETKASPGCMIEGHASPLLETRPRTRSLNRDCRLADPEAPRPVAPRPARELPAARPPAHATPPHATPPRPVRKPSTTSTGSPAAPARARPRAAPAPAAKPRKAKAKCKPKAPGQVEYQDDFEADSREASPVYEDDFESDPEGSPPHRLSPVPTASPTRVPPSPLLPPLPSPTRSQASLAPIPAPPPLVEVASPLNSTETEEYDLLQAMSLARVTLESRAEDYDDNEVDETTTPPRTLLQAQCIGMLGEQVFGQVHAIMADAARRGDEAVARALAEARLLSGAHGEAALHLVSELVSLEACRPASK
eukprot:m.255244 g.255244  ORF g.255244 m.255244 type:complete len:799 (+) comp19374_c0_seq1:30-2426(+)